MNGPDARWLELGEVPPDLDRPMAWLVRDDDPAWDRMAAGVRPSALDLGDAALFTSADRAAGRLRRRLLLKGLAGLVLDVTADQVVVERSAQGAIAVAAPVCLCASLSARDGWTMFGLSRTAIGVDVEIADPQPLLPLDMLCREEAEALSALPAHARPTAFARYWTVKEAVLKAVGIGLNVDPATLNVRFDGDTARVLDSNDKRLALAEIRPGGPGFAAIAVHQTLPPELGEVA